jgi:hydrogenase-4 component F
MMVGGEGWFFIDSFNVFLVALTAFVAFTTSLFSRPYMRIEKEHGRLNDKRLRLYHASYQIFIGAMLLALTTNNMGILWVSMEAATLATVLLVSLYRTPASLEAAWKYFILCGVGIALALFGTILLYFAAEKILGSGGTALAVDAPERSQGATGTDRAATGLRLPAGRLRHQGRSGAPA